METNKTENDSRVNFFLRRSMQVLKTISMRIIKPRPVVIPLSMIPRANGSRQWSCARKIRNDQGLDYEEIIIIGKSHGIDFQFKLPEDDRAATLVYHTRMTQIAEEHAGREVLNAAIKRARENTEEVVYRTQREKFLLLATSIGALMAGNLAPMNLDDIQNEVDSQFPPHGIWNDEYANHVINMQVDGPDDDEPPRRKTRYDGKKH